MKQLELKLQVKGEMTDLKKDVPTLEEMIQARKEKPKGLENLSNKMIEELKWLHRGRI
tara:strand:- start:1787 stop:1960 length:174 start_codon:yes stop_codon:yes gene_type:complete